MAGLWLCGQGAGVLGFPRKARQPGSPYLIDGCSPMPVREDAQLCWTALQDGGRPSLVLATERILNLGKTEKLKCLSKLKH